MKHVVCENKAKKRFWIAFVLPVVILAALLASCETSFEVFGDTDQHYSLFGFLDVSADTQWVRVELLKDSLLIDTGELDATMIMTTMSSGSQVEWRDSLFEFIGGGRAHNFWTTEPIEPLESYRLDVMRSSGEASSAEVTLPDTFDDPVFSTGLFTLINLPVSGNVCARTIDLLVEIDTFAALEMVYYVPTRRGDERIFRVDYIPKAVQFAPGFYEVILNWVNDLLELDELEPEVGLAQLLQLRKVELRIAAAGPNWPDNTLSDETVALPGAVTFVDRGLGFVGGVVSKRIELPIGDYRELSCFQ